MSEVEMLCMANSRKPGGRCIAGLLDDRTWIRPVPTPEGGAVAASQCKLSEGRQVQQLDVVRLDIEQQVPLPHQPENRLMSKNQPWLLLRTQSADKIASFLKNCEYNGDSLFGTKSDKVSRSQIENQGVDESLLLIRATRPRFYWKTNQLRVIFVHARAEYDLSVTFDLETGEDGRRSSSEWWLTVSLGDPWAERNNDCYKLVAGAIKVPRI